MNFLNAILLGGSAAMLAPLLIHLLNRSRFRTLDWGAMHLLETALQSNSRRFQWERWLLLLVRCLIPILFALALARPVLTSFQLTSAAGNKALVILFDDSFSMAATDGQSSLLEQGKSQLSKIIDTCGPAEIALWSASSPPHNLLDGSSLDKAKVRESLQTLKSAAGTSSTRAAFLAGLKQLQAMSEPNKQLIVVSDFQASHWRAVSHSQLQTIQEPLNTASSKLQIVLLPVGPAASHANVSVQVIEAEAKTHLGGSYRWLAQATNHGANSLSSLLLTFQIDGQEVARQSVALSAQSSEQVEFACEFTQLGWHHLALSVDDPSDVHGDDQCFAVVQVTPQPRITIVDDSLSAEQIQSQQFIGTSRYLRLALSAFDEPEKNAYAVDTIPSTLVNDEKLAMSNAVMIANVAQWSDKLLHSLNDYVVAGGGLLVFEQRSGDSLASTSRATLELRQHSSDQALPLFGSLVGAMRSVSQEQALHLETSTPGPSGWMAWNAATDPLRSLTFTRWVQLTNNPQASAARTLLRLSNGDPWLVEQEVGQGIVVQCASSCGDDGTNMPRQTSYVPLILSLAEKLTQHGSHRAQVTSGEPITLHVVHAPQKVDGERADQTSIAKGVAVIEIKRIQVEGRSGPEHSPAAPFPIDCPIHDDRASFTSTREPGVFAAKFKATAALASLPAAMPVDPALFAVAIDPQESQLTPLTKTELNRLADQLGASLVFSASEYDAMQKLQRDGWEFWRWIVLVVLALLFVELLFGLRLAASSGRGAA
ncbi:MAG: BatA domain-containing protein [Planctomycetales bacterium]|nr:BatA domain-containing protein [Planctomycetales bacterium]